MPPRVARNAPLRRRPSVRRAPVTSFRARRTVTQMRGFVRRPARRTNYRRRTGVRHHRSGGHITRAWNPSESLVPDMYFTRMRFVSGTFAPLLTTTISWIAFSPLSLNQPQLTQPSGTTLAPANVWMTACTDTALGLTQMYNFYQNYRVGAVTVRIEGCVQESNEPVYLFVGSEADGANQDPMSNSDMRTALMDRSFKHKLYTNGSTIKFTKKFYPYKIYGLSKNQGDGNVSFSGVGQSAPTLLEAIWIGLGNQDLAEGQSTACSLRVYLEYEVKFYNPQNVNASTPNMLKTSTDTLPVIVP